MSRLAHYFLTCSLLLASLLMTACAPSFYNVKSPAPSGMKYVGVNQPSVSQLSINDERRGSDTTFSSGILPASLKVNGQLIDPPKFLSDSVTEELKSRGLSVSAVVGDAGATKIHLKQFHILNHRSSAYSAFYTFTFLKADLETSSGTKRITAFVRRGKVPVWSFDEVVEPTFNQPLSIAVKEFSSKIANALYKNHASDDAVNQLIAKISENRTADRYLDVYALGFTNNPLALKTLISLTSDTDEYVRQAAMSSLGTMNAVSEFQLLKDIYSKPTSSREDRDMAVKAIGDLNTPETKAFITQEFDRLSKMTDANSIWSTRVLSLYL